MKENKDLKDFIKGYMVCALWSSTDESNEAGGDPMDDNYTIEDIEPDVACKMRLDCALFLAGNANDIAEYCAKIDSRGDAPMEWAGHDFWLTRNGHGCGYWDRDLDKDLGERLTLAAQAFPECNLYIGDDNQIYC